MNFWVLRTGGSIEKSLHTLYYYSPVRFYHSSMFIGILQPPAEPPGSLVTSYGFFVVPYTGFMQENESKACGTLVLINGIAPNSLKT